MTRAARLVAALAVALGGCTTLGVAPGPNARVVRPAPSAPPAPPAGRAAPPSAPTAPSAPSGGAMPPRLPGSGTPPSPSGSAAPPRTQSDASGATAALLAQSRSASAAGSYAQASAAIERALRIDPNDPDLWAELAEIELKRGDAEQAAALARKALSLAGDDARAADQAERVLRAVGGR